MTIQQIAKEFKKFDWSYQNSDSYAVITKGEREVERIKKMINDYLSMHPKDKKLIVKLSDTFQRKAKAGMKLLKA